MFERFFGGPTEEMQFNYLQRRVIITIIALVVGAIGSIFWYGAISLIALVALFVWG